MRIRQRTDPSNELWRKSSLSPLFLQAMIKTTSIHSAASNLSPRYPVPFDEFSYRSFTVFNML